MDLNYGMFSVVCSYEDKNHSPKSVTIRSSFSRPQTFVILCFTHGITSLFSIFFSVSVLFLNLWIFFSILWMSNLLLSPGPLSLSEHCARSLTYFRSRGFYFILLSVELRAPAGVWYCVTAKPLLSAVAGWKTSAARCQVFVAAHSLANAMDVSESLLSTSESCFTRNQSKKEKQRFTDLVWMTGVDLVFCLKHFYLLQQSNQWRLVRTV